MTFYYKCFRSMQVIEDTNKISQKLSLESVDGERFSLDNSELEDDSIEERLEQKYPATCIVLVNLKESNGGIWEASWILSIGEEETKFPSEGDLLDIVISEIIDSVADSVAEVFLEPNFVRNPETIELGIIGLARSTEFFKVLVYLCPNWIWSIMFLLALYKKSKSILGFLRSRAEESCFRASHLEITFWLVSESPIIYRLSTSN